MATTNLHPLAVLGPAENATGSLAGYCRTTYVTLIATLGPPHNHDIDGKVNVEWAFRCADGTTFHVYDWKEPAVPCQEYWWHIGGNNARSLAAFTRHTGLPITRTRDAYP
jgi:hypothetical protein